MMPVKTGGRLEFPSESFLSVGKKSGLARSRIRRDNRCFRINVLLIHDYNSIFSRLGLLG